MHVLATRLVLACFIATTPVLAVEKPVLVGIDAEFSLPNSTSAQAIERGARTAVDEINQMGGVLGGRPLEVVITDNRSMPARAEANLAQLAERPDLVAVLCGRFSTAVLDALPLIHEKRLVFLDPWASADGIIDNNYQPNYAFRLSLRDVDAAPLLMRRALAKHAGKIGILAVNNAWGRSNVHAAEVYAAANGAPTIVDEQWHNFGDRSLIQQYLKLRNAGAQAVILAAAEMEGAAFVRELAGLPPAMRLPVISTWGVTGGRFLEEAGQGLFAIDFSVVQSFSFEHVPPARLAGFMDSYARLYGPTEAAKIIPATGVAQAYDLIHILARAIDLAGSTDRPRVRDALERVRDYQGLVRDFPEPFDARRHEALGEADLFIATYRRDGSLAPVADHGTISK